MPRAHRPRRLAVAATALAGALAFSACEGGGDPTLSAPPTSPTTTAPPSATTSSVATTTTSAGSTTSSALVKPEFPAIADTRTPEGAEAFVRYYWAAVAYAWQKPDAEILPQTFLSACGNCSGHQEMASELLTKGRRYDGDPFKITRSNNVLSTNEEDRVSVHITQVKRNIVDASGKTIEVVPGEAFNIVCVVKWSGKWQLAAIG